MSETRIPVTENKNSLQRLENLDGWQVHENDPDVRGWNLYANGENVGEVKNLIASTNTEKIQYLEVELNDDTVKNYRNFDYRDSLHNYYQNYYGGDDDKNIIVPIGMVSLNKNDNQVQASPNLTAQHFSNSPRYGDWNATRISPLHEVMTVKYYADHDDNYRQEFNNHDFDLSKEKHYPNLPNRNRFYDSDFFSNQRYLSRHNNTNPTMSAFKTGMPRR